MSTLRERLMEGTATPAEQKEVAYLISAVKDMRICQKRYFACPERANLLDAKDAEANVDRQIKTFYEFQGELFE